MAGINKGKSHIILPKNSNFNRRQNIYACIFFAVLILLAFLPVLLVIMAAFSSENSVSMYGYRFIPKEFSVESFAYMFSTGSTLPRSFLNSVIITTAGTILSLIIMTPCAYAMSRKEFKLRGALMIYLMIPMIFSGGLAYTLGMIPFVRKTQGAHFIWHFFVLAGAALQWIGVWLEVF